MFLPVLVVCLLIGMLLKDFDETFQGRLGMFMLALFVCYININQKLFMD